MLLKMANANPILYVLQSIDSIASDSTNRHRYKIGFIYSAKLLFATNTCFNVLVKYPLHPFILNVLQIYRFSMLKFNFQLEVTDKNVMFALFLLFSVLLCGVR